MGIFSRIFGGNQAPAVEEAPDPRIRSAAPFDGYDLTLDDPRLAEFLREGNYPGQLPINSFTATRNTAVFRCLDIICGAIGKLPLYLMQDLPNGETSEVKSHPLYDILRHKPNNFQTAQQFKSYMQYQLLTEGNAYAVIVRTGARVVSLIPLESCKMQVKQTADWSLSYKYIRPDGSTLTYAPEDILHLRGLSRDGKCGLSRLHEAQTAIRLAMHAENAAINLFRNGMILGGAIKHPKKLNNVAHENLKSDLHSEHANSENAWKWIILEEGMDAMEFKGSSVSAQHLEQRKMQIEEIARMFGVPRPLLMMDDTSWGSGIEQLAILFVRFGLSEWFEVWEGAINTTLLTPKDRLTMYADFDEKELLRGSMQDQATYYAKALGSGGQPAWMTANEVRDDVGLGNHPDGDILAQQNSTVTDPNAAPADATGTKQPGKTGKKAANDR